MSQLRVKNPIFGIFFSRNAHIIFTFTARERLLRQTIKSIEHKCRFRFPLLKLKKFKFFAGAEPAKICDRGWSDI